MFLDPAIEPSTFPFKSALLSLMKKTFLSLFMVNREPKNGPFSHELMFKSSQIKSIVGFINQCSDKVSFGNSR